MVFVVNGYVGIVIYSDIVYVLGVYNGKVYQKKYLIYLIDFYEYFYRVCIFLIVFFNFKIRKIFGNILYVLDVYEGVFYKWFEVVNLIVE